MSKKATIDWPHRKDADQKKAPYAGDKTIQEHVANSLVHISEEDRTAIAAAAEHVNNTDKHLKEGDREKIDGVTGHTSNTTIHVTSEDKARWDGRRKGYIRTTVTEMQAITDMQVGDVCAVGATQETRKVYFWDGFVWDENDNFSIVDVAWEHVTGKPDFANLYAPKVHAHDEYKRKILDGFGNSAGCYIEEGFKPLVIALAANALKVTIYNASDTRIKRTEFELSVGGLYSDYFNVGINEAYHEPIRAKFVTIPYTISPFGTPFNVWIGCLYVDVHDGIYDYFNYDIEVIPNGWYAPADYILPGEVDQFITNNPALGDTFKTAIRCFKFDANRYTEVDAMAVAGNITLGGIAGKMYLPNQLSTSSTGGGIGTPTNGVDGITPHIDPTTKHWMLGTNDTGIVAEGAKGTSAPILQIQYSANNADWHNDITVADAYIRFSADSGTVWSVGAKFVGPDGAPGSGTGSTPIGSQYENLLSYGVVIDTRVASPILQRIGSTDLHKEQPILAKVRGCVLKDDATVNYYLDSNDVTKKADGTPSKLDGTDGQVMIEFPDMYRMIRVIDEFRTEIRFSLYSISGFEKIDGFYYSSVLAAVHRPTNKLSSVISSHADYRGGNNDATRDANTNTQLGMCATNLSRTAFRNYAQNRGIKYIGSAYYLNEILAQLYWCEYANLNMQDAYIQSLTIDGFRQGGLGIGVTAINGTNWSTFNGYYPLIPSGVGFLSVGVKTGVKTHLVTGLNVNADIPVWHGIEHLFGHMWQSEDGVNIEIQSDASGGLSKAWICKKIRFFADTVTGEYTCIGNIPRIEGYISKMITGTLLPLAVGGSSNTYYCDYNYTTLPTAGVSIRQVLRGGSAYTGSNAGLGCSYSNYAPSSSIANFASRLCAVKT